MTAAICRASGIGKISRSPFSPGRACRHNAQMGQQHQQSQANPERPGLSSNRTGSGLQSEPFVSRDSI